MRRLILATCLLAPLSAAQAASFDGRWTVDVTTDVGPCEKSFQGSVTIASGTITDATSASATAGFVEANGTVWARFSRDGQTARAQGHFSGAKGSGTWSSSTSYCGGRWSARKAP